MPIQQEIRQAAWPAGVGAATVDADPARRAEQTVEGPTLHDREIGFGRGLASSDRSPTCLGRSSRASARVTGPGRFLPLLLAALAAALLLAGCGGDDAAATDPTVAAPAPTTTDPATTPGSTVSDGSTDPTGTGDVGAADEETPGANEIAEADARTGQTVTVSAITPKKFAAAHCRKPILVVFYQPGSDLEKKLLAEARTAARKLGSSAGLVTLVYTPGDVKAFGDLPAKLGLLSTPGLATVSRDGTIENFWTTYVDNALILRSLRNAAAGKACSVDGDSGADESAEASSGSALADAAIVANGGSVETPGSTAADTGVVDPASSSDALVPVA